MALINNALSQKAGAQNALMETWRQQFPIYEKMQKAYLHYVPYTNIRSADYVFKQRTPFPKPFPYGNGRVHQGLVDKKITLNRFPYELTLDWDERDSADDQLGDMATHVSAGVKRFLQLPDVLIGEYMTGVPVMNYNGLALSYDGVSIYSTVDGSASDRFGVSGGNIITGSGTSTTAKVLSDILACRRRLLQFTEPVTGQPLHNGPDITYSNMLFIIPSELDSTFQQIAEKAMIYDEAAITTAQSNMVVGKIKYQVNQRLTDTNDWFVVVDHPFWKPFAYCAPKKVRQIMATVANSDRARETLQESMYCDLRLALSPWLPFMTLKVSNA